MTSDGVRRRLDWSPRRDPGDVVAIGLRKNRDVEVRRASFGGRFEHPPALERQQHPLEPLATRRPARSTQIDCHSGRMHRTGRGVARLMRARAGEAGHHELVTARAPVLPAETVDEQPDFGARVGKGDILLEDVIVVSRDRNEEIGSDEPAELRGIAQKREVVLCRLQVLTVERSRTATQTLAMQPDSTCEQDDSDEDREALWDHVPCAPERAAQELSARPQFELRHQRHAVRVAHVPAETNPASPGCRSRGLPGARQRGC